MDWIKLVVLGLQLIKHLIDWSEAKGHFNEGAQSQVHKELLELQKRTTEGKRYVELIEKMSEKDLDSLESELANAKRSG